MPGGVRGRVSLPVVEVVGGSVREVAESQRRDNFEVSGFVDISRLMN